MLTPPKDPEMRAGLATDGFEFRARNPLGFGVLRFWDFASEGARASRRPGFKKPTAETERRIQNPVTWGLLEGECTKCRRGQWPVTTNYAMHLYLALRGHAVRLIVNSVRHVCEVHA